MAMTTPVTTADLLFRRRLGVPWVVLILVGTCFLITTPLLIEPRRFYLTLGVGFCEEDGVVRWWHYVVAKFVHGAGCGFPPIWFHLGVNASLFLFQGALVERLLGSGRTALLTFTCLAVQIPIGYALAGGRAHGASGMTWSYVLFATHGLVWSWKRSRWGMLKDWVTIVGVLWVLFAVLGLVKHWHLWNLLVSVPFYLAWRATFGDNLSRVADGVPLDRGARASNAAGVGAALALSAFAAFFLAAAAGGWIQPAVVGARPG